MVCCRCEAALGEFLRGIHKSPNRVDYSGMINILIAHSQSIGKQPPPPPPPPTPNLRKFLQILAVLPKSGHSTIVHYTSVKHGVTVMTFSTFLALNCTKCQENRVDFQNFLGRSMPRTQLACLRAFGTRRSQPLYDFCPSQVGRSDIDRERPIFVILIGEAYMLY